MSDLESTYFSYTETGLICLVLFFHFNFVAQCYLRSPRARWPSPFGSSKQNSDSSNKRLNELRNTENDRFDEQ